MSTDERGPSNAKAGRPGQDGSGAANSVPYGHQPDIWQDRGRQLGVLRRLRETR